MKDIILNHTILYSLCITIAVFSYMDFTHFIFRYESYLFLLLLVAGILSFIIALLAIQNLLIYRKKKAMEKINQFYLKNNDKIKRILFEDPSEEHLKELGTPYDIITIINTEREMIMAIETNIINFRIVFTMISSVLLPIIVKQIQSYIVGTFF